MKLASIEPAWPAPAGVRALQTTRAGGVSTAGYASLNLATHVGDAPEAVAENRRRLRALLPAEPCWLEQVHGTTVVEASSASRPAPARADAVYTRSVGAVCVVMTADCLPVLLCDRDARGVAATHAGWRGLHKGVLEATVAALGIAPEHLLAWLGPAIGQDHFEVGPEVRAAFIAADPSAEAAFRAGRADRWHADLYLLARQRLSRVGLPAAAIYGGGECTFADDARYFSHRRDPASGRMGSLIWLEQV